MRRPDLLDRDDYIDYLAACLTERRRMRFAQVLARRTRHLTLVLEDIYDRHNASACLRSCDGFGVQEVHAIENRNPFDPHPEIALGAAQWLDLVRHTGAGRTADCLAGLRRRGYRIVATAAQGDARPLEEYDIRQKTALLFGNERDGVSPTALELADERVTIPMSGFTESLNISVAVAICLHDLTHRLRQSDVDWRLPDDDRRRLRARWIVTSVGEQRAARLTERFLAEHQL